MATFDVTSHKGEFFSILETTDNSQVATMTIAPGDDSGDVMSHPGDQVVYVINGHGEVAMEGGTEEVAAGQAIIIPADTDHKIHNTGRQDMFFVNIYAPPAY